MKYAYRTNFFAFGDVGLLDRTCNKYNVESTTNSRGFALVADNMNNLIKCIKESFNNDVTLRIHDDIVYVNFNKK